MSKRKQTAVPPFSACISEFVSMMDRAKLDYRWNCDEVNRLDKLTQDYLHKLELDGLNYKERARVATSLARCRQERRESKDMATILEPLVQFLDSEKGRQIMSLMKEVLGKTRRVEKGMECRRYIPRVLEE